MKQKSNSVIVCIPRNIYVVGTMSSVLRVLYFLLFGITNRSQRIMEWRNLDGHSVTFLCFKLLLLRDLNYDDPNCLKSGLTEMPTVISASSPPPLSCSPTLAKLPFTEKDTMGPDVTSIICLLRDG